MSVAPISQLPDAEDLTQIQRRSTMLPSETAKPFAHRQRGRLAKGAIALATAAFAKTMRVWIGLLNLSDRMSIARRRKAYVLVRAGSPAHRTSGGVTVTVTGLASREG